MSAPTPQPERPAHPERVVGIFVAVLWAAVVFAAFGVLAVLLDRDPIELPTSPYYGLVSLALAGVAVYLGFVTTVPRRTPWLGAVATAAGVYLVIVVSAGVVDLDLALAQATSPFVGVASLAAAATIVAGWALMRRSA